MLDPEPICFMVIEGRINKTTERANAGVLFGLDGATGIVTQLVGLAERAGWGTEFVERIQARFAEMP